MAAISSASAARISGVGHLGAEAGAAERGDDAGGDVGAEVGGDQGVLEVLPAPRRRACGGWRTAPMLSLSLLGRCGRGLPSAARRSRVPSGRLRQQPVVVGSRHAGGAAVCRARRRSGQGQTVRAKCSVWPPCVGFRPAPRRCGRPGRRRSGRHWPGRPRAGGRRVRGAAPSERAACGRPGCRGVR